MVVLVVSTGLMVFGCDAAFVMSSTMGTDPYRMSMDGHWMREGIVAMKIPMHRCDIVDLMLFSRAADPAQPVRSTRHLSGFLFRPGDLDLSGSVNSADLMWYLAAPYDYNLDGWLDATDFNDVMLAVNDGNLCE